MMEHPVFAWAPRQPSWPVARLSDVVSVDQLSSLSLYQEVLVPVGAAFSLFVFLSSPRSHQWVYVVANRPDHDFHDDDVAFARSVQPALVATMARWSAEPALDMTVILTQREQAVLGHLAAGLTASAMAHVLGTQPATVRKHLQHTYAKLGVQDRLAAVLRARSLGLLHDEDLSLELTQQIRTEMRVTAPPPIGDTD